MYDTDTVKSVRHGIFSAFLADEYLHDMLFISCAETEEGFVKVRSQRPVVIDQTVHQDVDVDDVMLPSVMITRFTQLKHFVKVI